MENLRSWLNTAGLVLFAPRPQIAAPAPSLVEAVLGAANPTPTLEQTAEARALLARLVAEGLAVPLNLMGPGAGTVHAAAPGDTPDFVASTAVFSYVFTLRGDKAWKQPPATTGALKMSNLALAIYEALSRRGPLSAYDLTTEVGKEVTEAAALRALGELWMHLRVIPLAQPDGAATLWELASVRFTKQIKAGANAGQPSALSALISLYLGQVAVASEEEIESFLSPLASRSRIRDVVHALLSARQLDTIAVEGRTMLHVTGALPAFLAAQPAVATEPEVAGAGEIEVEANAPQDVADVGAEAAPRITKFVPKPRKIGTGYLAKAKPSKFGAKPGPFERGSKPSSKPSFKSGKPEFKAPFKPREEAHSQSPLRANGVPSPRRLLPIRQAVGRGARARAPQTAPRFCAARSGAGDARPRRGASLVVAMHVRHGATLLHGARAPMLARDARLSANLAPLAASGRDFPLKLPARTRLGRGATGRALTGRAAGKTALLHRASPILRGELGSSAASHVLRTTARRERQAVSATATTEVPRVASLSTASSTRLAIARHARSRLIARPARSRPTARRAERSVKPRKPGDFAPRKFAGKPSGKPGGFVRKPGGKPAGSFAGKKPKASGSFSGKPDSTFAKFAGNKKPFGKRAPARKFKPQKGESA